MEKITEVVGTVESALDAATFADFFEAETEFDAVDSAFVRRC